mgnify:FL=1
MLLYGAATLNHGKYILILCHWLTANPQGQDFKVYFVSKYQLQTFYRRMTEDNDIYNTKLLHWEHAMLEGI